MKVTTLLFTVIMFGSFFTSYSQDHNKNVIFSVDKIGISIDNQHELKGMDWVDLFTVFDTNQPSDSITLYIQLKKIEVPNLENTTLSYSDLMISVKGITENKKLLKKQLLQTTEKLLANLRKN